MQIKFKNLILLIFLFLINLISCKDNSINVTSISNKDNSIYEKFILSIDNEPYEELEWITLEPTGGVILYNNMKKESILSYNFDNEIGEWWWELDNKKVSKNEALKFLNELLE